jgi:SRSO17 transposase
MTHLVALTTEPMMPQARDRHRTAVLVVDETGFFTQGTTSDDVTRRDLWPAGTKESCQVGMGVAYASARGQAFLDREL